MLRLPRQYPLTTFLILTFLISWYPWYSGGHGFKTWGPSMAGLIVAFLIGGWKNVRHMLGRVLRWRADPTVWVVAFLMPLALVSLTLGVSYLLFGHVPTLATLRQEPYMLLVLLLLMMTLPVMDGFGEEITGWQPKA